MKNSFHSDNFICLINATSQALTLSNNLTQSPSALQSCLIRKVHHIGCIRLIFCVCCSISMSLLLQRCFFNKHKFTVYNPRFLNASANALLIGSFASFACFLIYAATSRLLALFPSFFFLSWKEESFSLWPQEQTNL